ncbi:transposase [Ktedonobacter racemifer]|uniref:transposase n=1 Tax=Ktedonobacter racemifer TaxID=363277 RepID=UPI0009FBF4E2
MCWQGLITQMELAPANEHEGAVVEELVEGTSGLLLGDRNYWLPEVQQRLRVQGIFLQAPFKKPQSPKAKAYESRVHGRVRYRIETVFAQLIDYGDWKRMWARDLWHRRSRLLRVVIMHALCLFLNQQHDRPSLQFAGLIA